MARVAKGAAVISANRLVDGVVVWFRADEGWSEALVEAAIVAEADVDAALGRAKLAERAGIVVEPYRVEIEPGAEVPVPVRLRERIRAAGPTIHPDQGSQASSTP